MHLKHTILVAEDCSEFRESIVRTLQREGHAAESCASARELAARLARFQADDCLTELIITDMHLGDGISLDVLERAAGVGELPRFILMSAHMTETARRRALVLQAAAVLEKPLRLRRLRDEVYRALSTTTMLSH